MKKIIIAALLAIAVFTGCTSGEDDMGTVKISFKLTDSVQSEEGGLMGSILSSDIAYVELTVTPANITDTLCGVAPENGDLSGWEPVEGACSAPSDASEEYDVIKTVMVPVGTQTFTIVAYDINNDEVASGSTEATIVAGSTANVYINLFDSTGAENQPGHSPLITSLTVSDSSPVIGESITASVVAFDADDDTLSYQWTDNCDGGSFVSTNTDTVTWSGSVSESCELIVTVSDGHYNAQADITVNVYGNSDPTEAVVVSSEFVSHPYISHINLSYGGNDRRCNIDFASPASISVDRGDNNATCYEDAFLANSMIQLRPYADVEVVNVEDISWEVESSCGGSMSYDIVEVSELSKYSLAYVYWDAPSTPGACLLTFRITNRNLVDEVDVALLLE